MNSSVQNPDFSPQQLLILAGQCGYRIDDDRVFINVDAIANNRTADNLSGTLALELWALPQPYQGEDFAGFATASTSIGEILGQHYLRSCHYALNFQQPPTGEWWLVLMLREWQEGAYVTRDYINFAAPYTIAASKAAPIHSEKDNVISVDFGEIPARSEAAKPAKPTTVPARTTAKTSQPATKAVQPCANPQQSKTPDTRLSVNQAPLKELEAVKGISRKLAKNIFDNRPYKTADDLLEVKGMGPKLLKRLEDKITL